MAEKDGVEIESHRTLRRGTKWAEDGEMVSVGEDELDEGCRGCEAVGGGGTTEDRTGLVRTEADWELDALGDFGRSADEDGGSVEERGDDCIIFFAGELLGRLGMNAQDAVEDGPSPTRPDPDSMGGENGELAEFLDLDLLVPPISSRVSWSSEPSVPPSRTMTGSPTH